MIQREGRQPAPHHGFCTYRDLRAAQAKVQMRHIAFAMLYPAETIITLGIYFRKRKQ